jgi:hypothetical protein
MGLIELFYEKDEKGEEFLAAYALPYSSEVIKFDQEKGYINVDPLYPWLGFHAERYVEGKYEGKYHFIGIKLAPHKKPPLKAKELILKKLEPSNTLDD